MYIVYRATSPSNKVYIGFTSKTLARRKTRSEESKIKASEAQKGKPRGPMSDEHRAKLRAAAVARYQRAA